MLLKAEHVSACEDEGLPASPEACSETVAVHLTLQTQELFPPSSSDALSHEPCRFCALPLSVAPIFGAEVMPRSRTSVRTELLPWEELRVTRHVPELCARPRKSRLSCTDSPAVGNSRARP